MKRIYAVSRYTGNFGQSPAGCHMVLGGEEIVAEAPVYQHHDGGWREVQEVFMEVVRPVLCVSTRRRTLPCESRDEKIMHSGVGIPMIGIPGFDALIGLLESEPINGVEVSTPGIRLVIADRPPELAPGSVQMDGTNLAYQREVLAG